MFVREACEKKSMKNPLGTRPIGRLLLQFSVPGVIAMLVTSLYNIVDQFFIGNYVGELGNAATNIAFPLSILCTAVALLFGIGGASAFNLSLGQGEEEEASYYMVNSAEMLFFCGVVICAVTLFFLTPLLRFFGSPDDVLPYAQVYVRITAFGFPFMIFANGTSNLIRADGRPGASMFVNVSGAVLNILLDMLFVGALHFGIAGAAAATVLGQILSACIAFGFLCRPKTVTLAGRQLRPRLQYVRETARLGMAPCLNQLATMVVQISMNNALKYYGGLSVYGETIPIAVVGIATKVNQVYQSVVSGVTQGLQTISSFNYGAGKYDRVRHAFYLAAGIIFCIGVGTFLLFQLAPRQIISIFGSGSSELYYQFAVRYFRIYLFLNFINFMPLLVSNFFTAIGKPLRGTILSLTGKMCFFLPLLAVLPLFLGIDGILFVGPVSDALSVMVSIILLSGELRSEPYRKKPAEHHKM